MVTGGSTGSAGVHWGTGGSGSGVSSAGNGWRRFPRGQEAARLIGEYRRSHHSDHDGAPGAAELRKRQFATRLCSERFSNLVVKVSREEVRSLIGLLQVS